MATYDIDSSAAGSSIILNNVIRKDGETITSVGTNHIWAHRHVGELYAEDTWVEGNLEVTGTVNAAGHGTDSTWGAWGGFYGFGGLRYDGGYLQYCVVPITETGGLTTDIAATSGWINVPGWLYGA